MPSLAKLLSILALALLAAAPAAQAASKPVHVSTPHADRCDFLAPARCLLPWPNDYFTVADKRTDTGRRVKLARPSMPANKQGVHIDPSDFNRADGFSPGQAIVVKVPGLDTPAALQHTGPVSQSDMSQAFRRSQPLVVINARTHKRQLVWAELDSTAGSAKNTALIIRPGKNWDEGERYIVALRNLKDANGKALAAPLGFRVYRDKLPTKQRVVEKRRPHMDSLLKDLGKAGIARGSLYLAWDFTVASERSLAGRMLAIRDNAFAQLGDKNLKDMKVAGKAPAFTVDPPDAAYESQGHTWTFATCDPAGCQPGQDDKVALRITGTFTVPCYLNQQGCPAGSRFNLSSKTGLPVQGPGNVYTARYVCKVPRSSLNGPVQTGNRAAIYGHGLLGSPNSEINQGQITDMIFEHHFVYCGTRWIGMSDEDIPNAVSVLQDLSKFPAMADRLQQGMLNALFLSRLMVHPQGLVSNPAFQAGGAPLIDTSGGRGYYDGNSQGGIMGGAVTAVAPDWDRAALGVPGMNYSTLLQRSVDFNTYAAILYGAYPDTLDRQLYLSMLQMLWDRGEADGYAHHITSDPLPNTPRHQVLMQVAFGDHQVANVAAEVEARTVGAALYVPPLSPGRTNEKKPWYALPRIKGFPYGGSAYVLFDSGPVRENGTLGTPAAPLGNLPPAAGNDPHELPRRTVEGRAQKSAFLTSGGKVVQPCGSHPCYSGGWTGP